MDRWEWIHRRNLSPGELIYANSMVAEEIALENKKKKLSTLKQNVSNRSLQLERTEDNKIESTNKQRDSWKDSQTAKKAGVGVGTVARYNRVMKSDDESVYRDLQTSKTKMILPIVK